MRVKNINGTSDNICKCGTWLNHWSNFSRQPIPSYCPEIHCMQKPEVGAHVQKDDSTDTGWCIVPLCSKHNAATGQTIDVADSIALVSANVSKTCGR